ncbi:MAG: sugar ABC transporter ATP-binding protein [Fimbriimonadales bacterium]
MPRLAVRDLVMQFPAVRALTGVSLEFEAGQTHGIIGENGAGKSTLMRILSGLLEPTSGVVLMDEAPIHLRGAADAMSKGIAMIHQELNLVDGLTVAENIFLGREPRKYLSIDSAAMNTEATLYLTKIGAKFPPGEPLCNLSLAQKQLVEIAKAVSYNASVIIMDEPTAVLGDAGVRSLFDLIEELKAGGVTILYVSHRLAEVEEICDTITVLRDGIVARTLGAGEATQEQLAGDMVGRVFQDVFPDKTPAQASDALVSVEGVGGASFEVRPGEIVGLAGLVGSGRTELAEMLVGLRETSGAIRVDGRLAAIRSPRDAAKLGIAYVSEDRKDAGLLLSLDVIKNATLANLSSYAKPLVDTRREREGVERWVSEIDVRAGDLDAPILYLSGGNQQKVSIAKWLDLEPRILILDEPTRGVDIGAKQELYRLIHRLAADGMACIVISSEMPELIGLCHRILVMRNGSLAGELAGNASEEEIMMLAAGVGAA